MDCAVLGSTMAMNRAVLRAALPMPVGAAYQDWYMALVTIAFGRLACGTGRRTQRIGAGIPLGRIERRNGGGDLDRRGSCHGLVRGMISLEG